MVGPEALDARAIARRAIAIGPRLFERRLRRGERRAGLRVLRLERRGSKRASTCPSWTTEL